jgi:hypothetical protein
LLSIAERDLRTAARNLTEDPDWAYNIAYNAILQSARALMMSVGFRPRGAEHHATVVKFTEECLGKKFLPQVAVFDRMRRNGWHDLYAGRTGRSYIRPRIRKSHSRTYNRSDVAVDGGQTGKMTSLLIDPALAIQDCCRRFWRMDRFLFELCHMNKLHSVYFKD